MPIERPDSNGRLKQLHKEPVMLVNEAMNAGFFRDPRIKTQNIFSSELSRTQLAPNEGGSGLDHSG